MYSKIRAIELLRPESQQMMFCVMGVVYYASLYKQSSNPGELTLECAYLIILCV